MGPVLCGDAGGKTVSEKRCQENGLVRAPAAGPSQFAVLVWTAQEEEVLAKRQGRIGCGWKHDEAIEEAGHECGCIAHRDYSFVRGCIIVIQQSSDL